MFENVIGQEKIVSRLTEEIKNQSVPSSLLFYGPAGSGKMTAALEMGRVLSCRHETATWNCTCRSCREYRMLTSQDLIVLGARDFLPEILAASGTLRMNNDPASFYLYIRSVRKMTRRFDALLRDEADTKVKKAGPLLQQLEELLSGMQPEAGQEKLNVLKKNLDAADDLCAKIQQISGIETPGIGTMRNIVSWIHLSPVGKNKVVIIEGADQLNPSARNSLLKTLEEPPANVYFILLTKRKSAVMQTILSRVRPYGFIKRSHESENIVINRIFKNQNPENFSLREFFLSYSDVNISSLRNDTAGFLCSVLEPDRPGNPDLSKIYLSCTDKKSLGNFLEELTAGLRLLILEDQNSLNLIQIEKMNFLINDCYQRAIQYNMNPASVLEGLHLRLRKVVV